VAPDGSPQNKPVGYRCNAELGTIDIAGLDMGRSAKYRNIGVNPTVAFVVDDPSGRARQACVSLRYAVRPNRPPLVRPRSRA